MATAAFAFIFSSCAAEPEYVRSPMNHIIPDIEHKPGQPLAYTEYSDELEIKIDRPKQDAKDPAGNADKDEKNTVEDIIDYEGSNTEIKDDDILDYENSIPSADSPGTTEPDTSGTADEPEEPAETTYDPMSDPDYLEQWANAEGFELYNVPLSAAKQSYAIEMAKEFGIPVELIFGVMYVETRYNENAVSSNGKYIGIMQIAQSNFKSLKSRFGITDLQDYIQNVKSGAYFLSYFYKKYNGDIDKTLMCYHCGEGGAQSVWANGTYTDNYCKKVKTEIERIKAS